MLSMAITKLILIVSKPFGPNSKKVSDATALELFDRYATVSTTELEGVFQLSSNTRTKLVRFGFHKNSIEGISETSRIKKKEKIVDILNSTNSCFALLGSVLDQSDYFDKELLLTIHSTLLKDDNIMEDDFEIDEVIQTCASLIETGSYRHQPCYSCHAEKGYEIHFCPWKKLDKEMEWYYAEAKKVLNDETVDPYHASAWLQWAFLAIHPFADGNGRVARLISSIPLIKAYLPPVAVVSKSQEKYFKCLTIADRTGNIQKLAKFLKKEAIEAVKQLSDIDLGESTNESTSSASSMSSLEE